MSEVWVDIKGFENLYQISNMGKVRSLKNNIILSPDISNGYKRVYLYSPTRKRRELVHRLVAQAFIPNADNKPFIDHIDTNTLNNNVNNLRGCTQKENINNFKSLKKRHKPHTKEWCENIRKGLEKKPIFCVELGIVFRGQTDAQRKLGIFQTNIGKVLLGKRKTAGGYHWQYV